MDYLWTPWRFAYVSQANSTAGCVFCDKAASQDDQQNFVVHRGRQNFLLLNLFPYTVGHVMIVPYRHIATLEEAAAEEMQEMMELTCRTEAALRKIYRPQGINLGMNIGKSAGAGVAGHIHMHVLPRWQADANFMSVIGETRVLPETLEVTWEKLRGEFATTDEHR
ncbi:MAG TPA: HIT domain-containing protein [Bryobacterales bacterium]|nr:HIT domain-containing protein [Bryobacterales bacterium]